MDEIREKIKEICLELFQIEVEPEVTIAPEGTGADYASNVAFSLCKQLHDSPRGVAEKIAKGFENAEVAGAGFLNFRINDEVFREKVEKIAKNLEPEITQDSYHGKTVVCEFSDPNPFKVLHVGHLYTSVVGDAISRIVENAGGKVVRANFGGDVGLHVAKTLFILQNSNEDLTIEKIAEAYVKGTRAYEEDEEAKTEIVELNKKIYEINKEKDENSKLGKLYWEGRKLSYDYFEEFYRKLGVKFDKYYPESTVAEKGLQTVLAHTPEVYEKSDGAVVFKGEKYGLHTRVFVNKEGLPTYEAKDVGLIFAKDEDWHFDESIVITGNDIVDYMKVVLKSVEQYAPELVKKTRHLTHGNVRLPGNEKMSSRKGNFIKAVDILNEVREKTSDEKVAMAAIKYGFLKYRIGGNIEFNIDECVSVNGNSGPYLLYSAVRTKKILAKCEKTEKNSAYRMNEFERKLNKKIVQFGDVLTEVTKEKAPHILCNFLYELAQEFSRFYENCQVAGSEFEAERAEIVRAYGNVMEKGLNLLGIEIPEEM